MTRYVPVLFFFLLFPGEIFASPVRVTIALDPSSELPAIPVSLRVQATNPTSQRITVTNVIALQVTPPSGETFLAQGGPRAGAVSSFPGFPNEITLGPGETRDLTIWSSLDAPFFGYDRRLWSPGEYRLQLFIAPELVTLRDAEVPRIAELELSDPVISNVAAFTIARPQGDDAAVFALIGNTAGAWYVQLADRIWREYPHSRYAPFAIAGSGDHAKEIAAYEAAIARAPDSVIAEQWRLNIAHLILNDLRTVRTENEIAPADAVMRRVEPTLKDLARSARDPRVRAGAQKLLDTEVFTREELTNMVRRERGEITDIEPSIVCAGPRGKGFVAWLTYYNPGRQVQFTPVGTHNKFTPPPFDRGQPTQFRTDFPTEWFKVVADGPQLTWHIDGNNFRVEPERAERPCPADMDEYHDEYFRGVRPWPDEEN
jgi:hypothetical protein